MRYTLLLHYPEMTKADLSEEGLAEGKRAFTAYAETLHQAGVLLSAEVLQPSAMTTTLRTVDGRLQIQDGTYAVAAAGCARLRGGRHCRTPRRAAAHRR